MTNNFSAISGLIIPFFRAMETSHINAYQALEACGIDNKCLNDPEARIESKKFNDIINYCNKELGRTDFSIQVAKHFHLGMLNVLGHAMMSSSTLKDALTRFTKFKQVLSNSSDMNISENKADFIFNITPYIDQENNQKVIAIGPPEAWLATIVQLSRELLDQELILKSVSFCFPKPNYDTQYLNDFFKCPVEFNTDTSKLVFDLKQANIKLLSGNPLISQVHDKLLTELLSRVNKDDLINLVTTKICEMLPLGPPSQVDIASKLNMSLRNLQRKLQNKGTNYKDILDTTRKNLTIGYLQQKHLNITEISYLIGFSNTSNFNRAFKRWTNRTPGDYRNTNS